MPAFLPGSQSKQPTQHPVTTILQSQPLENDVHPLGACMQRLTIYGHQSRYLRLGCPSEAFNQHRHRHQLHSVPWHLLWGSTPSTKIPVELLDGLPSLHFCVPLLVAPVARRPFAGPRRGLPGVTYRLVSTGFDVLYNCTDQQIRVVASQKYFIRQFIKVDEPPRRCCFHPEAESIILLSPAAYFIVARCCRSSSIVPFLATEYRNLFQIFTCLNTSGLTLCALSIPCNPVVSSIWLSVSAKRHGSASPSPYPCPSFWLKSQSPLRPNL